MTAPQDDTRERALSRADSAALNHILVSTGFLGLGAILYFLSFLSLSFPDILTAFLSYGRVRPAAMTAVILGWLVPALVGGVYYVLPRLTGTALWREDIAKIGSWALGGLALLGVVLSVMGWGDGIEPLGLPWWLDAAVLAVLCLPLAVTFSTLRNRTEKGVFVTLWFVMAGVAVLPLLYAIGNLPGLPALARELGILNFEAGFTVVWITGVGTGLAYYVVTKVTDNPLANRQLARVGFWSLVFAATWSGPIRLAAGPAPDWLDPIAAVMGLGFPVAAIANTVAIAQTVGSKWEDLKAHPELRAVGAAMAFVLFVAFGTSLAGFGSASVIAGLTSYWDGLTFAALFGVGGFLVAGWVYQALPALTGRKLASGALTERHFQLTVFGVASTALLLMAAGIVSGFSWTGAAYAGSFATPAEMWAGTSGIPDLLIGISVVTALAALAGQVLFVMAVYRTITSGEATAQEVLVPREERV